MIIITKEVLDVIIKHGLAELPNEACGYLAGTRRNTLPIEKIIIEN